MSLFFKVMLFVLIGVSSVLSGVEVIPHGAGILVEDEAELTITVFNDTDEEVNFTVGIEGMDLPEQIRGIGRGPNRDEIEGRFAIFQDQSAWGWVDESVFRRIENDEDIELDYESFRDPDALNDVDLYEFDAVWVVGTDQSDEFVSNWADNLERFEEYISRGNSMFIEEGWNRTNLGELPGGLQDERNPQEGELVVGPEDNWMIEQCEFEEGQQFECFNTTHVIYPEESIQNIDNSDWYQIIMVGDQTGDPCEFIYNYGRGHVIVSGQPSSHVWNNHWNQGSGWGNRAPFLLEWLIMLGGPAWILVEPEEGSISANEAIDLEVSLNTEELEDGVYYSNIRLEFDLEELEVVRFPIVMSVNSQIFSVSGVVTDEDGGAAFEDVLISTEPFDMRRITDEEGSWGMSELPLGSYEFKFEAEDYLPLTVERNVEDEDDIEINIALLHSVCNPNIDELVGQLPIDERADIQFEITNDGNGPLTYITDRRLIGDANVDPFTIRDEINAGEINDDSKIRGVVFVDDHYFISGSNEDSPIIYVLNRDGEQVRTFDQPANDRNGMFDLTFDGELIWGPVGNVVHGFTLEGDVVAEFNSPFNPTTCIAWDSNRELFWVCGTNTDIVGINREGNVVDGAELDRQGLRNYGLAFWGDDPDDSNLYLYNMFDNDEGRWPALHKMNTNNGELTFVTWLETERGGSALGSYITNQFDVYSWVMVAVVHVPANEGGDRIDIWQLDSRRDWMLIEPTEGVIQAQESQEFTFTFDATDLSEEIFEGELVFTHDGIGGETIIPLSLDVLAALPDNPPSAFDLLSPENDARLLAPETITFEWERSIDPDEGDAVSYHIWFLFEDDSIGFIAMENSVELTIADLTDNLGFELNGEVPLLWWVEAESDEFIVKSDNSFSFTLVPNGIELNKSDIPTEFSIQSLYPNPFNSQIIVRFGLPIGTTPNIRLFDISGRLVLSQSLGFLSVGYHVTTLSGSNLSAGTYLMELRAEDEVLWHKIALVK